MFHKSWKSSIICLRISAAMEQLLLEMIAIRFAKTNVSLLQKNLWPIRTLLNDFIQQAKEQALADVPCQTQGQSQLVYWNLLKAYSAPVRVWYIVKVCGKCASVFLKLLWPSLKTLRVEVSTSIQLRFCPVREAEYTVWNHFCLFYKHFLRSLLEKSSGF